MTQLRQQIAQLLIMGFEGTQIDPHNPVKSWLEVEGLGGVLLFDVDVATQKQGKNLVTQQQISRLTRELKECAAIFSKDSEQLPLFIAIDYEGGAVDRLKKIAGCRTTLNATQLAGLSTSNLALEVEQMAETLTSLGFNLNFAPVVDLNIATEAGIIGKLKRSFSADPVQVANIAKQFVSIFSDAGIACCYKHFPGHGSAISDSHYGFVDVTETFSHTELIPYSLLDPYTMVMTAHVINRQLDPSGLPATLSHTILTDLLRNKMEFDGVIISDDLQMNAITHHFSLEESLMLTFNAGVDMVIFANQLGNISATQVIDIIEDLVKANKISENRIVEAYKRVVRLKQWQLNKTRLAV